MVTFSFEIDITTVDAAMSGSLLVGGLPFTSENQPSQLAQVGISLFSGFTFAGAYTQLGGFIGGAATTIQLRKNGSGVAAVAIPKTDIAGATCNIYGFGTYFTSGN
jgi:hypothetical protein